MKKRNAANRGTKSLEKGRIYLLAAVALFPVTAAWSAGPLVLQSDFGIKDSAVASMKGVAVSVSRDLDIYDLTHEVPTFNIWEASLRLAEVAGYWPKGTVFVSVVDPGVGTERKSVVLKTKSGHYFVSPDNGSLTAVAEQLGIEAVREIDEVVNRLANSEKSYTFHGRDRELPAEVLSIPYQKPRVEQGRVYGNIEILDPQFGNVWTNIDRGTFKTLDLDPGDEVSIQISNGDTVVLTQTLPYFLTFGRVPVGKPLLYLNSLNNVSLAINQGNYSDTFDIQSGASWNIRIEKWTD
jgi:S-adenosylmethionine hydrolase